MSVHSEIYTRLAAAAALTALVPESRITPQTQSELASSAPEQYPAVTFGGISAVPQNTLDGYSGLTRYRFQLDVWGRNYDTALAIARAARDAMIGSNTLTFSALWVDQREFYEQDIKVHNIQLDFSVTSED